MLQEQKVEEVFKFLVEPKKLSDKDLAAQVGMHVVCTGTQPELMHAMLAACCANHAVNKLLSIRQAMNTQVSPWGSGDRLRHTY